MIPRPRHRGSSSRDRLIPRTTFPDTMSNEDAPAATSSVNSFRTRLRRWTNKSAEHHQSILHSTDTLLPTTYSQNNSNPMPKSLTCNSFLMGGHYYPGKDKKRRHLRKKTCWYKLFCSSTFRQVSTSICILYLLVWHGLVPMGEWLMQVGNFLSSSKRGIQNTDWLQYDSTLKIPLLKEEQLERLQVTSERARLQYGSPQRHKLKLSILEEIVPEWYHRNDEPATKVTKQKQSTNNTPSSATTTTTTVNSEHFPFRTLHTMNSFAANHTSCSFSESSNYINDQDLQTTLVTQTSMDRLWILNETCTRWKDPIVAVVFVPHDQQQKVLKEKFHISSCPHIHLILYISSPKESSALKEYPVNRLRNVGLDAVSTSHVLVVDVDFLPSQDLHLTIKHALKNNFDTNKFQNQALIIPAFERVPPKPCGTEQECASYLQSNKSFLPHSFSELHKCVKNKNCIVFQSDVNWDGHYSTRSDQWLQEKFYMDPQRQRLKMVDCFHSARYEPYVVLKWCPTSPEMKSIPQAPYYDERFHGYGKNKIELISHLRKMGYQFSILPEGFIVHNPHTESHIKDDWKNRKGSDLHASMDKLYIDFLHDLDIKYKTSMQNNNTVSLCKH